MPRRFDPSSIARRAFTRSLACVAMLTALAAIVTAVGCSLAHPVDGFESAEGAPGPSPIDGADPSAVDRGPTEAQKGLDGSTPSHFLYVLGGSVEEDLFQDNVYYAPILDDGSLGPLEATTPLPTGIRNHTAVVYGDEVYVVGGELTNSFLSSAAFISTIRPDGRLGPWKIIESSLPTGRKDHAAAVAGDQLFLLGGTSDQEQASALLQRSTLGTGDLVAWAAAGALPTKVRAHAAITHAGRLFTFGGITTGPYSTAVTSFPIAASGALGAATAGPALPAPLAYHRAVVENDAVYLVGGAISDGRTVAMTTGVYRSIFERGGTLGAWATVSGFEGARWRHAAASALGSIYVVGGREGNTGPFYDDIQVARVQDNRELEWRALPQKLMRSLASHAVVIH